MNMQAMMREAQKLQKELVATQNELEKTIYEGKSSIVSIKINGKKEIVDLVINLDDDFSKDDSQLLSDMIISAFNDASKKADNDKKSKLGKYGSGLTGLL